MLSRFRGQKAPLQLLAARADVEKEDTKKGWKPICFAAAAGNAQVMKALLEVQADVNDSEPSQMILVLVGLTICIEQLDADI